MAIDDQTQVKKLSDRAKYIHGAYQDEFVTSKNRPKQTPQTTHE